MISKIDAPEEWVGDPRDAFRDGFLAAVTFLCGSAEPSPPATVHALGVLRRYRDAKEGRGEPLPAPENRFGLLDVARRNAIGG